MVQNGQKREKIEKNFKISKFSDIAFYMSKYHFFTILVIFVQKIDLKLPIFCLIIAHFLLNFEFQPSLLIRFSDPEIPIVQHRILA